MARKLPGRWLPALPVAAALAAVGMPPGAARADVQHIQFTGQVSALTGNAAAGGTFAVGETVVGRYTVDTTDLSPASSSVGTYALSNLAVTIGGDYVLTGPAGTLTINNGTAGDSYLAAVTSGLAGAPVNGSSPGYFDVQLDFPGTTFTSDAFVGAVPLASVTQDRSNINFPDDAHRLSFRVLTMSVVPEPTAAALLAPLLLAMLGRRLRSANSAGVAAF